MPSTLRARGARLAAALGLAAALVAPAAAPAAAADPLVLRIGTDQDLQVLNPWSSVTYADYEVYQLQYDTLVSWGQDFEPVPGFAESWSPSDDGLTWTFKIRDGMKWSDGEPATCEDARYTWQLVLDATAQEASLGSEYLPPYLTNAGLKAVTCPDPQTLVAELEFANPLILQVYIPILPAHVWSKYTLDQIGNSEAADYFKNEPPVVGTGPYVAVEWEPDGFVRFVRNENYWGKTGAPDEVIIQKFDSTDTMVQALKTGAVDYVRGVLTDQFNALKNEPDIETVEGYANGYTYLAYNLYPKPIEGGGASTKALQDVAFRDALNRAIDHDVLVDRILGGYGSPGTTQVPPFHIDWHVPPAEPRTFDIAEANRRLEAAGYALDTAGKRLDKEGQPITLRMTWPDSESELGQVAEFLKEWWGQLGIAVEAKVTEESALYDLLLLPEAGGVADWDTYLWGWGGDPDPTSLLRIFTTDEIGGLNDTGYSNPEYDELAKQQVRALDKAERKSIITKMQEIWYRDVPYDIPYYDSELHAYRTDKFVGWRNQPADTGTPLFGFGYGGYTALTDATAVPSPAPSPSPGASPSASAEASPPPDGGGASGGGDNTPLLIVGLVAIAAVVVGGIVALQRRSGGKPGEDDEE